MDLGIQPQSRPIHLPEHPSRSTGKERDSETGLDYFGARYYGSNMGRFTSADPLFIEAKRLRDPQRLNLYTYVRNNPLQYIDPVGLDIAIKCEQQKDCKTAEQQINDRPGTLLSVSDKNGLLAVQRTAAGPLTPQDQALADAINDPNNRGTLTVVNDAGDVTFGKTFGVGQNSVDVADTAKLGSPLTPGNAVAHEALESYLTGSGKSFAEAHGRATDLFGGLGPARGGFTYNADGDVSGLQYRQAISGTQFSISVAGHFQTPIPRVTLQFDRKAADKAYNSFHVDKVDIVPTTK